MTATAGPTTGATTGTTAALWRFPVKSMQGEQVQSAVFTGQGVLGDRAYALIDVETGKVVSAKSARLFPTVYSCRAELVEPPREGQAVPPVRITLPDGTSVTSDSAERNAALSRYFQREVRLATSAPEDFTIDQYHPDVEDADPRGFRDTVAEQKLGSAFFAELGAPSPVPVGAFVDLFPVSVLTTATLARLHELRPESSFDQRRFRMNLIIDAAVPGFAENDWVGRAIDVGADVRIRVTMPDPRCVMTTLEQPGLAKDTHVLRTLVQHNRVELPGAGGFPCAGAYAIVESPGTVRTGDAVVVS